LRARERHTDYPAAHIQHMQKELTFMNIQLHHVIATITGVTGMRIIREPDGRRKTNRSMRPVNSLISRMMHPTSSPTLRSLVMRRIAPLVFCSLFASLSALPATSAAGSIPAQDLVAAARSQIGVTVRYDSSCQRIAYPGGDVPVERGVCTDVVVRAYRKLGVDLQKLVHEDMPAHWAAYPHPIKWGLKRPDTNIDYRRVPNLATFFHRHGIAIAPSHDPQGFRPGDLVVWDLPFGLPHIGIVADRLSPAGTPLVIHNIAS
jgi:uncharacterized protein YijF (DUF1287 family)